jgi:hypothetical protein
VRYRGRGGVGRFKILDVGMNIGRKGRGVEVEGEGGNVEN